MTRLRLRQLVIASESLETADQLREVLDLGEPYADPGVAEFGLENAVFAIGNQFMALLVAGTASGVQVEQIANRGGVKDLVGIFILQFDHAAARTTIA